MGVEGDYEHEGAAFFFKQWGIWGSDGVKRSKHSNGKLLEGEVIKGMPVKDLAGGQYPDLTASLSWPPARLWESLLYRNHLRFAPMVTVP